MAKVNSINVRFHIQRILCNLSPNVSKIREKNVANSPPSPSHKKQQKRGAGDENEKKVEKYLLAIVCCYNAWASLVVFFRLPPQYLSLCQYTLVLVHLTLERQRVALR